MQRKRFHFYFGFFVCQTLCCCHTICQLYCPSRTYLHRTQQTPSTHFHHQHHLFNSPVPNFLLSLIFLSFFFLFALPILNDNSCVVWFSFVFILLKEEKKNIFLLAYLCTYVYTTLLYSFIFTSLSPILHLPSSSSSSCHRTNILHQNP